MWTAGRMGRLVSAVVLRGCRVRSMTCTVPQVRVAHRIQRNTLGDGDRTLEKAVHGAKAGMAVNMPKIQKQSPNVLGEVKMTLPILLTSECPLPHCQYCDDEYGICNGMVCHEVCKIVSRQHHRLVRIEHRNMYAW